MLKKKEWASNLYRHTEFTKNKTEYDYLKVKHRFFALDIVFEWNI